MFCHIAKNVSHLDYFSGFWDICNRLYTNSLLLSYEDKWDSSIESKLLYLSSFIVCVQCIPREGDLIHCILFVFYFQAFIEDWFGLRTLYKRNAVTTYSIPGVGHHAWHTNKTVFDLYIEKWLT